MNITITLTADNNFLTAVNALTAALTGKATGLAPVSTEAPKAPTAETSKAKEETKASAEAITKEVNGKTNGQITIEMIRGLVRDKSKVEETKKKIKGILGDFGAENVSSLQKEQYADFYNKINEL